MIARAPPLKLRRCLLRSLAQTAGILGDAAASAGTLSEGRRYANAEGRQAIPLLYLELREEAGPGDPMNRV